VIDRIDAIVEAIQPRSLVTLELGITPTSIYGYTDEENRELDDEEVADNLAMYERFNNITRATT